MNKKIKELAEQAGWMMSDEVEGFNTRLEKFAKLIVQACVSICKKKEQPNLYGVREIEAGIKEHFGVVK